MTYTVAEKKQSAIDAHWGGGTRYTLVLTSMYLNCPDKEDHYSSGLVVDKRTFDGVEIGHRISVELYIAGVQNVPVTPKTNA